MRRSDREIHLAYVEDHARDRDSTRAGGSSRPNHGKMPCIMPPRGGMGTDRRRGEQAIRLLQRELGEAGTDRRRREREESLCASLRPICCGFGHLSRSTSHAVRTLAHGLSSPRAPRQRHSTWGVTRALGGRVLLRFEDHDRIRSRPEYETAILEDLDWLGFEPDEGRSPVLRQSDALEVYRDVLSELKRVHHVTRATVRGPTSAVSDTPGAAATRPWTREFPGEGCAYGSMPRPWAVTTCSSAVSNRRPQSSAATSFSGIDGHWTYQFAVTVDDLRQASHARHSRRRPAVVDRTSGPARAAPRPPDPGVLPPSSFDRGPARRKAEQVGRRHRHPRAAPTSRPRRRHRPRCGGDRLLDAASSFRAVDVPSLFL